MVCQGNVYKACLILLILTGCATEIMKSYVGKDINEAVFDYGPPVNIIEMSKGKRAYQWTDKATMVVHGATYSSGSATGSTSIYGNHASTMINGSGSSYTTPSFIDEETCYYTLFAEQSNGESWIVTGFRKPRFECE